MLPSPVHFEFQQRPETTFALEEAVKQMKSLHSLLSEIQSTFKDKCAAAQRPRTTEGGCA